jgi:hypothetical protein
MIKTFLQEKKAYVFMPVQGGYGAPGLDFHCAYHGRAFFIEAKAPGKKPTPRQNATAREMRDAGAPVFIVSGPESLKEVEVWMATVCLLD